MRISLLTAFLVAFLAGTAGAGIVYSSGQYDFTVQGRDADTDGSTTRQADRFTFTSSTDVDGMNFWGMYNFGILPIPTDSFTIVFYGEFGGLPATSNVIATFSLGDLPQTDTLTAWAGREIFEYQASFSTTTFAAGNYWVSVTNTTPPGFSDNWQWCMTTTRPGSHAISADSGSTWGTTIWDQAFQLTDSTVPEPATILLFGLGAAGAAAAARRRRKRRSGGAA